MSDHMGGITSALAIGMALGLFFGSLIGHNRTTLYYVKRLKAAGLAYHDKATGRLIIDLPEIDQQP